MKNFQRSKFLIIALALLGLVFGSSKTVFAAEVVEQDIYFVAADTVIKNDLYVSANEMIIEGRVDGDVFFVGSFAEISGEIDGDLMGIAAGFEISGRVADDVRLLTSSVVVSGEIGGDLVSSGGGGASLPTPGSTGSRNLTQGIFVKQGRIGGDMLVGGGLVELAGQIDGNVRGTITSLVLRETEIAGHVNLGLSTVEIDDASRVLGEDGFQYTSAAPLNVPSSVSETIVFDQIEPQTINWFARVRRAVGALAGFALLGFLLLRYRPQWLIAPAAVMTTSPVRCFFTGLIVAVAFLFLPILTIILSIGVGLFWGVLSGIAAGGFLFLGLILIWTLSPLITGIWLGQRFSQQPFQAMLIGAAVLVALTLIPALGAGFATVTFMFALGALILSPRMTQLPPQV